MKPGVDGKVFIIICKSTMKWSMTKALLKTSSVLLVIVFLTELRTKEND